MQNRRLKAGLFSAFGHEHEVRAPISQGTTTEGDNPSAELTVDARQLQAQRARKRATLLQVSGA